MVSEDFWKEHYEQVAVILFRASQEAVRDAGILAGHTLGVAFSPEALHLAALAYARRVLPEVVAQITKTSMEDFIQAFTEWHGSGQGIGALERKLKSVYRERAALIAATETTRAFNGGNQMFWQESKIVTGKKWYTNVDEFVCPICGALHEEVVGLQDAFSAGVFYPPAHPRCRCQMVPVVQELPGVVGGQDQPFATKEGALV